MAQESNMNELLRTVEGDASYKGDQNGHPFVL